MFAVTKFPVRLAEVANLPRRILRPTKRRGDQSVAFARTWSGHDATKEGSVIERAIEEEDISELPTKFNFTRDVIDLWARRKDAFRTDVPALWTVDGDKSRSYSFQELSQLSKRIAGVFNDLGLTKGDRILICLPKCAEFWLIALAALRCGLEVSTATAQATAADLAYRIERFKPKIVVSTKIRDMDEATQNGATVSMRMTLSREDSGWLSLSSLMKSAKDFDGHPTAPTDPAIVFFTSGTTGKPKMAVHPHSYPLGHLYSGKHFYGLRESDVFWCLADPGWAKVAYGTFPTWLYGACVFVDTSSRFAPQDVLKTLRDFPITKFCAPPTVYRQLVKEKEDSFQFKALEDCVSAGEPLNPEAFSDWKDLTGISIRECYGQSETTVLACTPIDATVKPGSMGPPREGIQMEVLDDEGKPLETGEVGQLAVKVSPDRPIGIFTEYRDEAEVTTKAFKNGYYLTGDRACQDEDGYLWFVSRTDDVITSAGYRIGPFEVESVLLEHPAVVESAVVGVPDPERYEAVKAFVVLTEEYRAADKNKLATEIQEFVKKRTAPYKYPREVEFIEALPKTISGKIQRNILRGRSQKSK